MNSMMASMSYRSFIGPFTADFLAPPGREGIGAYQSFLPTPYDLDRVAQCEAIEAGSSTRAGSSASSTSTVVTAGLSKVEIGGCFLAALGALDPRLSARVE